MKFTNKDLEYLKDIFNWNFIAHNDLDMILDSDSSLYKDACKIFHSNMNHVLDILGGAK